MRSVGARSDGQVSGGMLFTTAWRTQTREAVRSLISSSEVEEEAGMMTLESLRNVCWRDLDDGNERLAFAQAAMQFMAGVAIS